MPSSMQMSSTFAPFSTCCRAILTASSYLPSLISLANFGDPATLVRSPMMMYTPGCCVKGCDPERRRGFVSEPSATFPLSSKLALLSRAGGVGSHTVRRPKLSRRQPFQCLGDGGDVLRRVAATATSYVDQPSPGKISQVSRHVLRSEIKSGFRQRIRQPGVWVAGDRHVRLL